MGVTTYQSGRVRSLADIYHCLGPVQADKFLQNQNRPVPVEWDPSRPQHLETLDRLTDLVMSLGEGEKLIATHPVMAEIDKTYTPKALWLF
jgi:hypothetical protein